MSKPRILTESELALKKAASVMAGNLAWQVFEHLLEELATTHAEAHEDEAKTPEQRAEHLHAMKALRLLAGVREDMTTNPERFADRTRRFFEQ